LRRERYRQPPFWEKLLEMPSFLQNFWSSTEQLSTALLWLTIAVLLSPAIFGVAAYFVNERIGALKDQVVNSQTKQIGHLNEELSTVRAQATELEVRAQNAERGVSDTYDFNGAHRQTVSGRSMITVGGETVVFRTIIDLYNAKKWGELENECERQIRATPKWLTPYLYSGIAYVNRGVFDRAKERLEFVVKHSGNDPDYSDAARILGEIKSAAQR
jgi:hypothetical protein